MNVDVSSLIGFATVRGRALLGFYAVGTAAVVVLNLGGVISPVLSIGALVLLIAALVVLTLPSTEPLATPLTIAVVALVEAVTLLMAWNVRDVNDPGYAAWHQGAITFVLLVLLLRGRRATAWYAFAGFAVISVVAATTVGQDVASALNACARQAGTLLIGTLFAIVLRRAARAIATIGATQVTRATRDAATATAIRERAVQNARLERDARPALERIAVDRALSDFELRAIGLLEESLRDGITAAGFSGAQLADDIRFARNRGIRVVLIDDRGADLPADAQRRIEEAIIRELRLCRVGTVTARLSPVGSRELATVIVDELGSYRSVVVDDETVEITRIV